MFHQLRVCTLMHARTNTNANANAHARTHAVQQLQSCFTVGKGSDAAAATAAVPRRNERVQLFNQIRIFTWRKEEKVSRVAFVFHRQTSLLLLVDTFPYTLNIFYPYRFNRQRIRSLSLFVVDFLPFTLPRVHIDILPSGSLAYTA